MVKKKQKNLLSDSEDITQRVTHQTMASLI